jgi:lipopolysaccharide transport system permease protein
MVDLAHRLTSPARVVEARTTVPSLVIRPSSGWALPNLAELWQSRELLYFLVWRDVKVRYKQTAVGGAWAILQPLFMMVIFALIFGRVDRLSSSDFPYPLFTYCALLPWQFFMQGLNTASVSLVVNERLITKVYFPRILVPSAAVLAGLLDLAIASSLLIGLMAFYGVVPSLTLVSLPLFVILVVVTTLGLSFWLSALDIQYRDVRHTIPVLTQLWLLATPIFYPSDLVPEAWRLWYGLNPVAGVVEGFRWALLGGGGMPEPLVGVSVIVALVVFVSGLFYFRRMERLMADVV